MSYDVLAGVLVGAALLFYGLKRYFDDRVESRKNDASVAAQLCTKVDALVGEVALARKNFSIVQTEFNDTFNGRLTQIENFQKERLEKYGKGLTEFTKQIADSVEILNQARHTATSEAAGALMRAGRRGLPKP